MIAMSKHVSQTFRTRGRILRQAQDDRGCGNGSWGWRAARALTPPPRHPPAPPAPARSPSFGGWMVEGPARRPRRRERSNWAPVRREGANWVACYRSSSPLPMITGRHRPTPSTPGPRPAVPLPSGAGEDGWRRRVQSMGAGPQGVAPDWLGRTVARLSRRTRSGQWTGFNRSVRCPAANGAAGGRRNPPCRAGPPPPAGWHRRSTGESRTGAVSSPAHTA